MAGHYPGFGLAGLPGWAARCHLAATLTPETIAPTGCRSLTGGLPYLTVRAATASFGTFPSGLAPFQQVGGAIPVAHSHPSDVVASFAPNPTNSAPTPEVSPALSLLRERNCVARNVPPKIRPLR
jgi:hypothetical protein